MSLLVSQWQNFKASYYWNYFDVSNEKHIMISRIVYFEMKLHLDLIMYNHYPLRHENYLISIIGSILCFYRVMIVLLGQIIQDVPKIPPFLEGTSFRDVVECWKNIFFKS
jgi:hypothetical protein